MKKILFVLLILTVCFIVKSNAQSTNCKKFKNGTFKMTYQGKSGIIKRNGNIQDEYFDGSKIPTMSFTVKWLNDCTYTLDPTAATRKKNPAIPKDGIMTVKITKTTANSYFCAASFNFEKNKIYESEMILTAQ